MREYLAICEVTHVHHIMVATGGDLKIQIPKVKMRKAPGSQVCFPNAGSNLHLIPVQDTCQPPQQTQISFNPTAGHLSAPQLIQTLSAVIQT